MRSRLFAGVLALLAAPAACAAASPAPRPCHSPEIEELRTLINKGAYAAAKTRGEAILAEAEEGPGPDSLDAACVMEPLSKALRSLGQLADGKAMQYAKRAESLKTAILGENHEESVSARSNLAWTLYRTGDVPGARDMFEKVLASRLQIFGPGAIEVAWAHENLGNVLVDLGEYHGARLHLEAGIRIDERVLAPDDPDLAKGYRSMSRMLQATGDYDGALGNLEKALAIAEKPGNSQSSLATGCYIGLTALMDLLGEDLRALDYSTLALGFARQRASDEPLSVATCLNNQARIRRKLKDLDKAEAQLEEALRIVLELSGEKDLLAAAVLFNLGEVARDQGNIEVARAHHERALRIRREILGSDHPFCGTSYEALAALRSDEGDYRGAIAFYEKALAIWRAKLAPGHPDAANSLNGEGLAFAALGDLGEAERRFDEALEIRRAALGPRHPLTASATANLATVLLAEGQSYRALNLALGAEDAARDQVRLVSRVLPERVALGYALSRPSGLDTILDIAAAHPEGRAVERAWTGVIRSRAIVLDEMASRRREISPAADPRTLAAAESLAATRRRYAHLTIVGPDPNAPAHYPRILQEAAESMEAAERELASASAAYRRSRELQRAGLAEVSAALPEKTALVAYVRYLDIRPGTSLVGDWASRAPLGASTGNRHLRGLPSYLAFVLSGPGREPSLIPLGSAGEIDGLVERWSRSIRSSAAPGAEEAYRAAARKLRETIWDPVAGRFGAPEQVLIVPDGSLFLVDLATLPDGDAAYLAESAPLIHYLSTERDVIEARRPPETGGGLLALGGPSFDERALFASLASEAPQEQAAPAVARLTLSGAAGDDRAACGAYRTARFKDLPAARTEAGKIAEIWERAALERPAAPAAANQILTGPAASEEEFKRAAPGKRILHIATHGFFMGDDCRSSSLLSRSAGLTGPIDERDARDATATNPLLLTGFALAGANHRNAAMANEEDGILTAMEIASMDLSGAEWAVLAGCETGAGRIETGEGVLGLRRAFQIAGARTIIMSLWSMEDADALAWMLSLYRHRLLDGMSTAAAVREADVELLEKKRAAGESTHPSSWGGWIASGAWD